MAWTTLEVEFFFFFFDLDLNLRERSGPILAVHFALPESQQDEGFDQARWTKF
jgi:hypothetical protein